MALGEIIAGLIVNMTMNTADFTQGAQKAGTTADKLQAKFSGVAGMLGKLGIAISGGVIIGAISNLAAEAFDMASNLSEAAEKVGVTVEGLQRLRVAASQTGVESETLDGALSKLNKSLGSLQLGKGAAVKAFEAIGLSAQQLKGMKTEDAFRLIAEQLSKIPDVQTRVALGNAIFGKSFSQLLPLIDGGAKALDEYAKQSQAAGEISTEEAKKLDDLADTWDAMKHRLLMFTADLIANTVKEAEAIGAFLTSTKDAISGWAQTISNALTAIVAFPGKVASAFTSLATQVMATVTALYNGLKTWLVDKLGELGAMVTTKVKALAEPFVWLKETLVGHSVVPDMVDAIDAEFDRLVNDLGTKATEAAVAVSQNLTPSLEKTGQSFGEMADKALTAFNTIVDSIRGVVNAFKSGGFLDKIQAVGNAIVNIAGAFGVKAPAPKFAGGGAMQIGGVGGTDRNLLSLNGMPMARVSRGEWLGVGKAGSAPAGRGTMVVVNAQDAVLAETVKGWVAAGIETAAQAGSNDAVGRIASSRRRSLV